MQRLIVPYVLDRLDCQNLQGMFVEAMRSQHRHLAEHFRPELAEESALGEWNHLPFLRDYHAQTRILEAKELHDYIGSEFWTLIPEEKHSCEGLQNLLSWDGLFKAYILTIFPQSSLAPLQQRLGVDEDSLRALASELSHYMGTCFMDAFLGKRAEQLQVLPGEERLWEVEMLPALSQGFYLHRPQTGLTSQEQDLSVWQQMRGLNRQVNLRNHRLGGDHLWLPWVNEEDRHGKYERFLIYNARINISDAQTQALFLLFIPESGFGFLQKALRRYLECLGAF